MPYTKITLIFSQQSADIESPRPTRSSGWSESCYTAQLPLLQATTFAGTLASKRAGILGKAGQIIGYRIQDVLPAGRAFVGALIRPGTANSNSDIAQMSIFADIPANGSPATRRVTLRGIPDDWVRNGQLILDVDKRNRIDTYVKALNATYFFTKRNATQYGIFNITAPGVYKLTVNAPWDNGAIVQVKNALTEDRRRRGGSFVVSAKVDATKATLDGWPHGATVGGTMRVPGVIAVTMNTAEFDSNWMQATTRKAGRVFFQSHGAVRRR